MPTDRRDAYLIGPDGSDLLGVSLPERLRRRPLAPGESDCVQRFDPRDMAGRVEYTDRTDPKNCAVFVPMSEYRHDSTGLIGSYTDVRFGRGFDLARSVRVWKLRAQSIAKARGKNWRLVK